MKGIPVGSSNSWLDVFKTEFLSRCLFTCLVFSLRRIAQKAEQQQQQSLHLLLTGWLAGGSTSESRLEIGMCQYQTFLTRRTTGSLFN